MDGLTLQPVKRPKPRTIVWYFVTLALGCVWVSSCSGGGPDPIAIASTPAGTGMWASRIDSTRALDNPSDVNYRLYINSLSYALTTGEISFTIDWTNAGPDTLVGPHDLLARFVGPVDRTVRIGGIPFGTVVAGSSISTMVERTLPPDIMSGSYEVYLQVLRTSGSVGPLDVGLHDQFFIEDRFFQAGMLTVP